MSKGMKRISAFLCMIMLLAAMIPATVFAANEEEAKAAVYVQVPQDWENPCVWAWDEEGNNAFEAWPGEEMEQDAGNEGWYYIWLPAWANHVIVNANEGSVQTEEQILEGKDAWITITAADAVEISYEKLTTGDVPEYTEKFVVHAKVDAAWENPCLWAWSAPDGKNAYEAWPGIAMKAGENGWYSAKAPIWVNSIIVNANEGAVQTEDITIDPAEVWVTIDAAGTADFSYTDPDKAEIPNVTVKVQAPADWSAPCLWAWSAPDGTNVYSTWPGEALEDQDGWLTKEIPGWVNSIIINANEGAVQTTDITVETGKNVWVVVNGPEDYTVSYEEPENTAVPQTTEAAETEAAASEEVSTEASNNMVPVIIVIVVIIAVAAAAAVIISRKKKEK